MLGNGQAVTLAFGGDVHFEGVIRPKLANDPASVFAAVAPRASRRPTCRWSTSRPRSPSGARRPPKDYTFRAPTTAFDALRLGHVDVVTMANNHGIDFGPEGLAGHARAEGGDRFPSSASARNAAEAYAPWRTEINGQRIAVFGASEVIDNFARELWRATDVQAGHGHRVPGGHRPRCSQRCRRPGPTATRSSSTSTTGASSRRARTIGRRRSCSGWPTPAPTSWSAATRTACKVPAATARRFADYGLGNFVFYNDSGAAADTGVLVLTVTGRRTDSYQWVPARVRGGVPVLLEGPAADQAVASWNALRDCTGLAP